MNRERMELLLAYLQALPPDEFEYSTFFCPVGDHSTRGFTQWYDSMGGITPKPHCGTAACVAGHTVILFRQDLPFHHEMVWDAERRARELLELTEEQSGFLFLENCGDAELEDAIRRLQFLLDHPDLANPRADYDWTLETYNQAAQVGPEAVLARVDER